MKEFNVIITVDKEADFDDQGFLELNIPLLLLEKEEGMELRLTDIDVKTIWEENSFDPDILKYLEKQLRKVERIDISQCTDRLDTIKTVANFEDFTMVDLYTLDLTIKIVN